MSQSDSPSVFNPPSFRWQNLLGLKSTAGSSLTLFPGFPFDVSIPAGLAASQGTDEASQVPDTSLPPCQALGPRPALGNLAMRKS